MRIDASMLPEGYSTSARSGLYAEFHRDGSLAHYGNYRNGLAEGWTLTLEQGAPRGLAERHDLDPYPGEGEETEEGDPEGFQEWAERWISSIAEKASHVLRCSFCGKSQQEVRKLIAGPSQYICNECVELCHEILQEETSSGEA